VYSLQTINNNQLLSVTVNPGPLYGPASSYSGLVSTLVAGVQSAFTVTGRDLFSNLQYLGDDSALIRPEIDFGATRATSSVAKTAAATYTVTFSTTVTGTYQARIFAGTSGQIGPTGSVSVTPAATSNVYSSVFNFVGGGLENTFPSFFIQARDIYNNLATRVDETNPSTGFKAILARTGSANVTLTPVGMTAGSGQYNVTYQVPAYSQSGPNGIIIYVFYANKVVATLNGVITQQPQSVCYARVLGK